MACGEDLGLLWGRAKTMVASAQPEADSNACFHAYFPKEERTGVRFLVHGDLHVEPHRKYLVKGEYNQWLFREAARHAANEFLTAHLRDHRPNAVFAALAPRLSIGESSELFARAFANALLPRQAVLAPSADVAEFGKHALQVSTRDLSGPDIREEGAVLSRENAIRGPRRSTSLMTTGTL